MEAESSYKSLASRSVLERHTIEGDSPVCDSNGSALPSAFQSSTELVELRVKLGGPPSKAKYSSTTDSDQ